MSNGDTIIDHTARRMLAEVQAKIEGIEQKLEVLDSRGSDQYAQLNRTFKLKLDLDYEDYQARVKRQREQDERWDRWQAEFKRDQMINRAVQCCAVALILVIGLLWIGARFL